MTASVQMVLVIAASAALALMASRHAVRAPSDTVWLGVLTPVIGLPLWVTCDAYLLHVLPTVWWFDPREPFSPYFLLYLPLSILLYLPLSILLAVTPAAGLIVAARRCAAPIRRRRLSAVE